MGEEKLKRTLRSGHLSAEEAARDEELRRKVQEEFPPARSGALPAADSISEALKKAIRESGRPVDEICRDAGVSQNLIDEFLSGRRGIQIAAADRLASVLGLKLTIA